MTTKYSFVPIEKLERDKKINRVGTRMGKIIKYCKGKQNVSSLRRKNPREKTVGQEGISMDKD